MPRSLGDGLRGGVIQGQVSRISALPGDRWVTGCVVGSSKAKSRNTLSLMSVSIVSAGSSGIASQAGECGQSPSWSAAATIRSQAVLMCNRQFPPPYGPRAPAGAHSTPVAQRRRHQRHVVLQRANRVGSIIQKPMLKHLLNHLVIVHQLPQTGRRSRSSTPA